MAQGLDLKLWDNDKSPPMNAKTEESLKRSRGVGSRRIFPPQFKLQVLDSYRNDVDCRGNQRATARKYNIHRRQIQKWLQCEQNLRICVEESAKKDVSDQKTENSRKKLNSENDKKDMTLNRNATTFTRLGYAGRLKETNETSRQGFKQENKVFALEEVKVEAQNLKRVAQKLYPSLLSMPCITNEKSPQTNVFFDEQNYIFGDVSLSSNISSRLEDDRDDNFNEVIRADNKPLDLKTKIHSEILPKEFLDSKMCEPSHDDKSNKLRIEVGDNCQSQLTSSSGNIGGQKLSVSNAVLKCLVQKYNIGDIDGQELCAQNCKNVKLLCSQSLNRAESSCLLKVEVPKNSNTVPYSPDSSVKKIFDESKKKISDTVMLTENSKTDTGLDRVKMNSELLNKFDCSKSFSPKRKWINESMREMKDEEHFQHNSSLPIKQRVKMNIKSLPKSTCNDGENNKSVLCSNFTIEKLCSADSSKETENSDPDCYTWHSSCNFPVSESSISLPPPIILPNRIIPDFVSLHFNHDMYNDHQRSNYMDETSFRAPFKEEKMSDNEDMDIDILNTAPSEKKSFDFSGYNFGKRRSFSVQFKLTVLDAFYNDKDCNKNQRATARKFNINRRQVQKWLSQESDLRSGGSLKNGKYLQRQRLGGETRFGGNCTHCPQHCLGKKEENLYDKTIEVNVKPCTDQKCLSKRDRLDSDHSKTRLSNGSDYYNKMENFSYNYFTTENNVVYHDSILVEENSLIFWKRDPILAVDPVDIAKRYTDFSRVIFKEFSELSIKNFLSYGINRRRIEYKNCGNNAILVEKQKQVQNSLFCRIF